MNSPKVNYSKQQHNNTKQNKNTWLWINERPNLILLLVILANIAYVVLRLEMSQLTS